MGLEIPKKPVLVAGATGAIGQEVVRSLLAENFVNACTQEGVRIVFDRGSCGRGQPCGPLLAAAPVWAADAAL